MKKLLFGFIFIFFAISNTFAQLEQKIIDENVVAGSIFLKGKETAGYFKKMGVMYHLKQYAAPWQFQNDIKFIEKDVFEKTEKIKNKLYTKYEAEDLDGYKYDTLNYESVKYSDMSAVGFTMIPKKMFLRKISSDKISLFYHHDLPPTIGGTNELESYYIKCAQPNLVYRIGSNGKLKLVNNLDVKKEMSDCPLVVEKHQKGEYKLLGDKENKTTRLNKFMNNTILRENARLVIIEDYLQNCK